MLKKVKRHRKRRENKRHKKEKKAIRKLKADLFFLFLRQAFIKRCKIYKVKKEYPPGGIIQDQTHDLGGEYIVPKKT